METQVLNDILRIFQDSILPWGAKLGDLLSPLLVNLAVISWVFLLLAEVCAPWLGLFPTIFRFLLGLGFIAAFLDLGPIWTADLFFGVQTLTGYIGASAPNPSAIAGYGLWATKPLLDSLADQGWFWWTVSPTSWAFGFAALCIVLAHWVLALQMLAVTLLSYFLIVTGPFFMVWAASPWTRFLAFTWVRWVAGTVSGMFCILVLSAHVKQVATVLRTWLQTDFVGATSAPGWAAIAAVGGVGVCLLGCFLWIPQKLSREVDSLLVESVSRGGAMLGSSASSAVTYGSPSLTAASQGVTAYAQRHGWTGGGESSGGGTLGKSPWGKMAA